MPLTIVGLGPGPAKLLTSEAIETLTKASRLYLRTSQHPTVAELPGHLEIISFDEIYDSEPSFEAVYEEIVSRLEHLAAREDVIYAVPGHPLVGEATVARLLERVPGARIIAGLSYIEPACSALSLDALDSGLQLADALAPGVIDPGRPALIAQVFNRRAASQLKLAALRWYPEGHTVTVLQNLALETESSREVVLSQLDHGEDFDHLTVVYLPPLALTENVRSFEGLRAINATLRAPGGCPWDIEQTHQTLKADLIEETYEVLAAIDDNDPMHLAEELGDLLNQVLFHTQIASEDGDFEVEDVLAAIGGKLVRRHPHVFGDTEVSGSDEVLKNWERIKREEDPESDGPLLERVPRTLPALHQASAVLARAGRGGFKWPRIDDILEKLREEVEELNEAVGAEQRADEFGDILFNLVNAARYMEIDAEDALRLSITKFRRRFARLETLAEARRLDLHESSLADLMKLWAEAKGRSDGDETRSRAVRLKASTTENEAMTGEDLT